jgi:hypothetical protein
MEKAGLAGRVPSWLPSRPLLVGYLAAKGLLAGILLDETATEEVSLGEQWHSLLDSIAHRESMIDTGIDGATVRRILERLATKARASQGSLGALSQNLIVDAFREVCGYLPGDRNMVLLQRLPGLGVDSQEEDSRMFVDETFADACRAGDVISFISDPFAFPKDALVNIESAMSEVGLAVALYGSDIHSYTEGKLNAALAESKRSDAEYMATDLVRIIFFAGHRVTSRTWINGVYVPRMELQGVGDLSHVGFQDCFFSLIELDADMQDAKMPSFRSCYVDRLDGRVSEADLPKAVFDENCVIESFLGTAQTTADVLTLDIPLGCRVCIAVLKKVYEQRGSGRRENALYRSMDHNARRLVSDVLRILQSEGLLFPDRSRNQTIWRGSGACRTRVGQIIAAPTLKKDQALMRCGAL